MTSVLPLKLSGVGLTIGQHTLLKDIHHTFTGSSISVVMGHNGAGKTLLLKICHGLIPPTAGRLQWHRPARAKRPCVQAMVFQRPVLLRRSVEQNIRHVLKAGRIAKSETGRAVQQALAMSRLTDMASRPARQLSGGEQQRVALARAWAARPEVLILDEPCTYLDPAATLEVEQIITAFYDAGTKIIMATHDIAQARRLAGEIILMHQGKIAECAGGHEFFGGPCSDQARAFLEGRLWTRGNSI